MFGLEELSDRSGVKLRGGLTAGAVAESEAVLIFSATLTRTGDRSVLANRVFSLRGQAPTASPEGGAQALARLVKESAAQLQDWMCRHIRQDQQGE